jgi:hypothetical protein
VNFTIYHKLNNEHDGVLRMQNIKASDQIASPSEKAWCALIYTCYVFFPLKLKIDELRISRPIYVLYIFLIYVLGVISLAYMANFVFNGSDS